MKGLWIKDLQYVYLQKYYFIMIVLLSIGSFWSADPDFILTFFPAILSFFTQSSISYDELDHGYTFLFTLPISRKDYVIEKYRFMLVFLWGGCLLIDLLMILLGKVPNTTDTYGHMIMIACAMVLVQSILIPIRLKFGMEKSRIVMFLVFGGFFLLIAKLTKVFASMHLSNTLWLGIFLFLSVIGYGISRCLSIRIMNKKEF